MGRRFTTDEKVEFFRATDRGDVDTVRAFLANGFPVNQTCEGKTALHRAATSGHIGVLQSALLAGASVNLLMIGDDHYCDARTALNVACRKRNTDAIIMLLDHGANPRILTDQGDTALHCLTTQGARPGTHENTVPWDDDFLQRAVQRMLDLGVPINQTDSSGNTILHGFARRRGTSATLIRTLLDRGANVNARNSAGQTPLHHAVMTEGRTEALTSLLKNGADLNAEAFDGSRPLHHACRENLPILLSASPDLEAKDNYGRTALATKLLRNHYAPDFLPGDVAILIQNGARLDTADHAGTTPADIIRARKLTGIAAFVAASCARQAMSASGASRGTIPSARA